MKGTSESPETEELYIVRTIWKKMQKILYLYTSVYEENLEVDSFSKRSSKVSFSEGLWYSLEKEEKLD